MVINDLLQDLIHRCFLQLHRVGGGSARELTLSYVKEVGLECHPGPERPNSWCPEPRRARVLPRFPHCSRRRLLRQPGGLLSTSPPTFEMQIPGARTYWRCGASQLGAPRSTFTISWT